LFRGSPVSTIGGHTLDEPIAYHFEFDPKNRVLRGRFEWLVTDQIITEFYARIAGYVARILPRAAIVDFSAVTSVRASSSTMLILAKSEPIMKEPKTIMIVIAPGEQSFGMSRMFQMLGESTRPSLRLVRSQEEAFAMLGIQDARFELVTLD